MAQLAELRHNGQIMPKQIPQDELDAILEAVTEFPEGASVEDLSGTLEKKLPRRTLQRRWARLVDQERLLELGESAEGKDAMEAQMIPLIRQDLCPLSFVDVPDRAYIDGILGVYELNLYLNQKGKISEELS